MELKETPIALRLIEEAEMLISNIEDRLSHVLLPSFPATNDLKHEEAQSDVTVCLRRIVRRLGEISDRIEN